MTFFQAGESALSYCYSNLSKKANNSAFEDYGAAFTKDDVISAMIDFEAANNNVEISFAKNGEAQGVAFSVPKADLAGQGHALFPHISVRNVKIEANFGKDKAGNVKENWFPLPEGFKMAAEQIEIAQRGFLRPEKRDDCEVIMMVGLPGCGKTTWATKHMEENFDKHFNLIGTSNLLDRMKVNMHFKLNPDFITLEGESLDFQAEKVIKFHGKVLQRSFEVNIESLKCFDFHRFRDSALSFVNSS